MGKRKLETSNKVHAKAAKARGAGVANNSQGVKRKRAQDVDNPAAKPVKNKQLIDATPPEPTAARSSSDDESQRSGSEVSSSDDGSNNTSSSHGASVDDAEELEVDFDFGDPEEEDFHILKALLNRYLNDPNFDSSTMADLIIDQAEISVALRTTESCVGVAALLPLSLLGDKKPLKQLVSAWRKHAVTGGCAQQLDAVLEGGKAALLISERVHNAPAQVAAGVFACLCKELRDCASCSDAEVSRHAAFDSVLVCAKAYEDRDGGARGTGAVPVSRRDQNGASTGQGEDAVSHGAKAELVFIKAEDEALFERCSWSCSWPIPQDGSYKAQASLHKVLMCVKRKSLKPALKHVAGLFGHDLKQHGL